ncbi:hypothetical protein EVC45_37590 [Paraburkholderia sp. UYCP14C]|uniref:hypothetical protein n=1 Tax=Paraburkholderia sp. UYCP14C TaxID=2511130 RepID=UPI001021ACFA|nr:hypothetical protein [Paraburkholderia sp. UYCP14C]RZF24678.1 hypothetical protein EVC45_37590 [Paraburkholderia sp. UYCP14C]
MSIFNKLLSLTYRPPALPRGVDEIGDYKKRFTEAIEFTNRCGFKEPAAKWLDRDVLGSDEASVREAFSAAGIDDLGSSAGQCLKWCHYLRPFLERSLGVPVRLTIGQLWTSETVIYSPTWEDIRRWSESGIDPVELAREERVGVNFHAWLTLETGEIIEPTMPSSIAMVRGGKSREILGGISWGREPGFFGGHRYVPLAVGNAIAEAIGGNPYFYLLARAKEDLNDYPRVGVLYALA